MVTPGGSAVRTRLVPTVLREHVPNALHGPHQLMVGRFATDNFKVSSKTRGRIPFILCSEGRLAAQIRPSTGC